MVLCKKNPVINSLGLKKSQNITNYNEEYLNCILPDREEHLADRDEYTLSPESENTVAKAVSSKKSSSILIN